jgi:hypothetical protein
MTSNITKLTSLTLAALTLLLAAACGGGESLVTSSRSIAAFSGFPLTTFTSANFSGSGNCGICHSRLKDAQGNDVSIDSQWRSTMMANAAKDPFWQANVAEEVLEFPAITDVVQDACALCHMPAARTQAMASQKATTVLGNGFLDAANSLHEAAMDGNTCSVCHQIQAAGLGSAKSFGNFQIDTGAVSPTRPIYGPYPNPLTQPMQSVVGYTPTQGAQVSDAGLCATCHTVYTPFINDKGEVGGTFPEQTAYLEWQQSTYGAGLTCQGCHMPAASGVSIAVNPTTLAPRSIFYQHQFVGGNVLVLKMMQAFAQPMGVTASTAQLEATIANTQSMIGGRAATLSIAGSALVGNGLSVTLKLTDAAGHKFPTGFPSRRAWIHLTVKDASGKTVFESGKVNADGSIAGNDADAKAGAIEPHYDLITSPDQVQIYESIMGDVNGKATYVLLRGAQYLKDNRILPLGFEKGKSLKDTAVTGDAYADANFKGGGDEVTYRLQLKGAGPYTITAQLLYQEMGYRFAQSLFSHKDSLITGFNTSYQSMDKTPSVVASLTQTIS